MDLFDIKLAEKFKKEGAPYKGCVAFCGLVGGRLHWFTNTACHASLLRCGDVLKKDDYIISQVQDKRDCKKDYKEAVDYFINWAVTESNWAEVHAVKDVDFIKKYGWVMFTDKDSNLTGSATYGTRFISEHASRLAGYADLLEKGFSGAEALILAYTFRFDDKQYTKSMEYGGHTGITLHGMDASYVAGWLKNRPQLSEMSFFEAKGFAARNTNNGVMGMWQNRKPVGKTCDKILSSFIPTSRIKTNDLNIFRKIVEDKYTPQTKEDFRDLLDLFMEQW